MSDESCVAIEILKEIPFSGPGDTVESRLRKVHLRNFEDVRIYENAKFEFEFLTAEQIEKQIHTPQPSVYQTHLDKIEKLRSLFLEKGINILNLEKGYDYIATSESGKRKEWTIIPPTVETFSIPRTHDGKLNYSPLIGSRLANELRKESLGINRAVSELDHTSESGIFNLINDGSHRIHSGYLKGGIKVLKITGMTPGYPYYAAPQLYSAVRIHQTRDQSAIETKIHVVDSPGHKNLYRLFPSGGIKSGDVRPPKSTK